MCDNTAISEKRWNIANREPKVCNMEVEIVMFVAKGSTKLHVPPDRQE